VIALLVVVAALLVAGGMGQRLLSDVRRVPSSGRVVPLPTVSVVVPARNESTTLPLLLGSLRDLSSPVHEVVVVDDASDDGTSGVARAGRAVVLPALPPPAGWTGKAWACHRGARATTGSLLLFLDADVVLTPEALDGLLTLHARHGGLVSVQPHHRAVRPYEQLSAYFNVVSLMASGAFAGLDGSRPMAFGPCLVTSRSDYERAGGHAAVRSEVLDDAMLAVAYTRAGLAVRCAVGAEPVRMRMYPGGWSQLVEGWTKNIASGAAQADRRCSGWAALWLAAHWAVAAGALLALVGAVTGWSPAPSVVPGAVWVAAWVCVSLQLRSMLRRAGSFRWWTWVLFPLPLLVFTLLFARSLLATRLRHEVRWRGRKVPIGDGSSSLRRAS
jgi:hypothetical protein